MKFPFTTESQMDFCIAIGGENLLGRFPEGFRNAPMVEVRMARVWLGWNLATSSEQWCL